MVIWHYYHFWQVTRVVLHAAAQSCLCLFQNNATKWHVKQPFIVIRIICPSSGTRQIETQR